jgi:FkbM family methyltransferase
MASASTDYSQNGEEKIILKELGSGKGFFIDIGAFDGEKLSNTRRLALNGWSGILVEPHPAHADKCRTLYADRSDVVTAEVAICDRDGSCDMFANDTFYSTLDAAETRRWTTCKDITFAKVPVKTMTFETFFRAYVYDHQTIDFASIDAEGSDYVILRDMLALGVLPRLVCVEHNGKIYDQCFKLLSGAGYTMVAKNAENLIMRRATSERPIPSVLVPTLVSYAKNGREEYTRSMRNLAVSLVKNNWPYEKRLFTLQEHPVSMRVKQETDAWRDYQVDSVLTVSKAPLETKRFGKELHAVPYEFKYSAVQSAREAGFTRIMWADSSLRYVGRATDLAERLEKTPGGVLCWTTNEWPLEKYISKQCATRLGVSLEQIRSIPQIIACFVGFNFANPVACEIYEELRSCSRECFADTPLGVCDHYVGHRHDQATLSVILWKHGISPETDDGVSYDATKATFFHARGIIL